MKKYVRETFVNQEVRLDFAQFEKCKFVNCTMIYGGSGRVVVVGCTFENVTWVLVDAALNTLNFLIGMYHGSGEGGRQLIENLFEQIRRADNPQQAFVTPVTTSQDRAIAF